MNKVEAKKRIEEVIRTTATVADDSDFMLTHMPFRELVSYIKDRPDMSIQEKNEFYRNAVTFSEEDLLDYALEESISDRLIVIQGQNGSGKSHLVRWIYYRMKHILDNEINKMIFVPRENNSLKETLELILNSNVLGDELTQKYKIKLEGNGAKLSEDEIRETFFNHVRVIVKNDESDKLTAQEHELLYKYLSDSVISQDLFLVEDGPIDALVKYINSNKHDNSDNLPFVESDIYFDASIAMSRLKNANHNADFDTLKMARNMFKTAYRQNICDYLNSIINKVIERTSSFSGSDLESVFKDIRKELRNENKNLILYIEDITAFTGIDQGIFDVITAEGREDNGLCRLTSIVAVTDGFFDEYFRGNLIDRITKNVVILERALLKNSVWKAEFAARYINALNISKEETLKWSKAGYKNYPIYKSDVDFETIDVDGNKMSIFPFNISALENLYECLSPNARTPRDYLKYVIKQVCLKWIDYGKELINHESNFYNESIINIGGWKSTDDDQTNGRIMPADEREKRSVLLKIWGNKSFALDDNGYLGGVSDQIFDYFNVKKPDLNAKVKIEQPSENVGTKVESKTENVISQSEKELKDRLDAISLWQVNPDADFKYHREVREKLLKNLFVKSINWDHEEMSYEMVLSVISQIGTYYIEGQGGEKGDNIYFGRNAESADLFKALYSQYYRGKGSWDYKNGNDDQIVVQSWILLHKDEIVKYINDHLCPKELIDEVILRAAIDYNIACGNIDSLSEESIVNKIFRDDISNINANITSIKDFCSGYSKDYAGIKIALSERYKLKVGSKKSTDAKYIFLNYRFIKSAISNIISNDLYLKVNIVSDDSTIKSAVNIINEFSNNFEKVIESAFNQLSGINSKLIHILGPDQTDYSELFVRMKQYLSFIHDDANVNFSQSQFALLYENSQLTKLAELRTGLKKIVSENDINNRMLLITNYNLSDMSRFEQLFDSFISFIESQNKNFIASDDSSLSILDSKKTKIIEKIKKNCLNGV